MVDGEMDRGSGEKRVSQEEFALSSDVQTPDASKSDKSFSQSKRHITTRNEQGSTLNGKETFDMALLDNFNKETLPKTFGKNRF
eukprot:TRINITY_DN1039_c0_g1_i1.p1 TRINITY_DN1039_c0_g1~~TRINITY_DN1039_c0_g1_i1.p1  ORF type:complete len:97 (+),score=17.50 TRINITY_DN1039_c0_g1_i1:42-293(+)